MSEIYFYGHTNKQNPFSCFSQWYEREFMVSGFVFQTAEHAMMFWKASLFGDYDVINSILAKGLTQQEVKDLGRKVKNFDQKLWDEKKFGIVVTNNICKFVQHPDLLKILMDTNNDTLIEASPYDKIWGSGWGADTHRNKLSTGEKYPGQNLLGKAIMNAREAIREGYTICSNGYLSSKWEKLR